MITYKRDIYNCNYPINSYLFINPPNRKNDLSQWKAKLKAKDQDIQQMNFLLLQARNKQNALKYKKIKEGYAMDDFLISLKQVDQH